MTWPAAAAHWPHLEILRLSLKLAGSIAQLLGFSRDRVCSCRLRHCSQLQGWRRSGGRYRVRELSLQGQGAWPRHAVLGHRSRKSEHGLQALRGEHALQQQVGRGHQSHLQMAQGLSAGRQQQTSLQAAGACWRWLKAAGPIRVHHLAVLEDSLLSGQHLCSSGCASVQEALSSSLHVARLRKVHIVLVS